MNAQFLCKCSPFLSLGAVALLGICQLLTSANPNVYDSQFVLVKSGISLATAATLIPQEDKSKSTTPSSQQKETTNANESMPPYRIEADGFGASQRDIRKLLNSAGMELWKYFPGYEIEAFVIRKGDSPIVLFRRNARREIVMKLGTEKTYWSQYSYQFAHEFCHILCAYEDDYAGNKWFEETLCETASLFVLRAMSKSWETNPPYPNWKGYRKALAKYAEDIIKRHSSLNQKNLADFYRVQAEELRKNATNRKLNSEMAVVLLGLFEKNPESWEAIRWINHQPSRVGESFHEYLNNWHTAVPDRHKAFVKKIAELYRIEISLPKKRK